MDSILIVDDEKDILEALRRMLRGVYEVDIAESPFEALKWIQTKTYHVIVSDQRMPDMSGVEFLEKAKKLSPLSTRILLTGYTDIESVIDSINRGNIYRYISKPWEPEDLKLTLRQANEAFLLKKELEDKNKRLEKALEDLTVLDRAKGRFLSLVSHELNTPLTILNSFIELIVDKKTELSQDVSKAVSSIQKASNRLGEIISQVIDYVGLESSTTLKNDTVNLSEILKKQEAEINSKDLTQGITVGFDVGSSLLVKGDGSQLEMAFRYLLMDTILRTPKNGKIDLVSKSEAGIISIEIGRDGEDLGTESFEVLETGQSQMHHQKNLGLSLAVFKKIIQSHSGSVKTEKRQNRSYIITHLTSA